jgi:hypothetical protein
VGLREETIGRLGVGIFTGVCGCEVRWAFEFQTPVGPLGARACQILGRFCIAIVWAGERRLLADTVAKVFLRHRTQILRAAGATIV